MKNKLHILICLATISLMGCNNWLDVRPDTEVYLDDMYADQQGFQDALIGAYLDLKNNSIYGQDLMYGTIEFLAQHWDYTSQSIEEHISRYNYIDASVQTRFTNIYSRLYATIASANMVLEQIDSKSSVFETDMYEIIKGEALAMRAFCHFDLLRLWGPMPTQTNGTRILPYVTTVGLDYHEHHTYEAYTSFLETDLLQADSLLKSTDPILLSEEEIEEKQLSVAAQDFIQQRQIRFNYYAVKALEARFYLWLGGTENKAKAYACAKEVIEATNAEGEPLFSLGNTNDISDGDYSFSKEHILAIYDYELEENAEQLFSEDAAYSKTRDLVVYDLYTAGTTDIRFQLWRSYSSSFTIQKFKQDALADNPINQKPLIRLAEMYFIAMECGDLTEANELYKEFCISRDIPIIEITNVSQLEDILVDEYNKEFYGEGQAFYAFKRLAVENILWAQDPGDKSSYVVPLPQNEVNYNH